MLLTTWSLLGCYRHTPVALGPTEPIVGYVRIFLKPSGTQSVRFILGENTQRIDGLVDRTSNDSLYLSAESARTMGGRNVSQYGVAVAVARADVLSLEARQPDKKRSFLAMGALAAVLVLAVATLSGGSFGSSDGGEEPTPPVTRIPR